MRYLFLFLCLCEAAKAAHIDVCAEQHIKSIFPRMSAYFTSASYINRPVYPLAPTSLLCFPYSFIPNWKWFPNNQFPCHIWSSLCPNHSSNLTWNTLVSFFFFFLLSLPPFLVLFTALLSVYLSFFSCPEAMDRKARLRHSPSNIARDSSSQYT